MKYRGYSLRDEVIVHSSGARIPSVSIYDGEKRLAPTSTVAMAKRVIDSWVARGRFATGENTKEAGK